MTSGIFHSVDIDSIIINRDNRIRKIIEVGTLSESINRIGLIHPIVITRDNLLVAGERRLTACRMLGWTNVSVQYADELSKDELEDIELEENLKRSDLTWQEIHEHIMRIDQKRRRQDPSWTAAKTAKIADYKDESIVLKHYKIEKYKHHPRIVEAKNLSTAINIASNLDERAKQDEMLYIHNGMVPDYTSSSPVIVGDFNEWAPTYNGPKFNVIHCDFPYGINAHKSEGQDSAFKVAYDDSPDIYWTLFKTLSVHLDNFCAESAHIIFWFSPTFYSPTWELLKLLEGFQFDEHPLIWSRGNEGIAPDPQRRPRRTYDMAFFGWRNDRKIVRMKNNLFVAPTEREIHPHEKSQAALEHFLEMCVDGQTRLFDPTCGSGSALRAAMALGANSVFGLERDEEFVADARRAIADISRDRREM